MSSCADPSRAPFGGREPAELAEVLGVPRVVAFAAVESTQDIAHRLAQDGAPEGTVVLAETQTAGRGRQGRAWQSAAGQGLWFTLVERPRNVEAIELLALRAGLGIAPALDRWAGEMVQLKWPNDLYLSQGKLGGILSEARWRDGRPEWVAIGVGINLRQPAVEGAASLRDLVDPVDVLAAILPSLREAVARSGVLAPWELEAFRSRDHVLGRRISAPAAGVVRGLTAGGELVVQGDDGVERRCRSGSLILERDA